MDRKLSFPPIVSQDARVLILGTLPGEESLRKQEYYAHPRNNFWAIAAAIFGSASTDPYVDRCASLTRNRVAVWDVLQTAQRHGSLDSNIRDETPNLFGEFFALYPKIDCILFNGQKAHTFYARHVLRKDGASSNTRRLVVLPSTSPANTRPFDEKVSAWRDALSNK